MYKKPKQTYVLRGDPTKHFLDNLADRLDPPELRLQRIEEETPWIEPPDIVDWAHYNFIDPVTEKLIKLQPHQARLLRTIFRMIWDKQVVTVVYSDLKKCLAHGELITLADGSLVPVEKLRGLSTRVYSFGKDLKSKELVTASFSDNGKEQCIKITTRYGFSYVRTLEHPFLTAFGWKSAEQLKVGDRLMVPLNMQGIGRETYDENKLKYLAYILADGGKDGSSWTKNDPALIADMKSIAEAYNLTLSPRSKINSDGLNWRITSGRRGGNPADVAASNPLLNFVRSVGAVGKLAKDKKVPDFVFTLCDKDIALFLNRLYSGDGGVEGSRIFYYTTSKQLAKDVQYLLLRLGIVGQVVEKENAECKSGFAYSVIIGDRKQIKRFKELVDFLHTSKAKRLATVVSKVKKVERDAEFEILDKRIWRRFDKLTSLSGKTKTDLGAGLWYKSHAPTKSRCLKIAKSLQDKPIVSLCESSFGFDAVTKIEYVGVLPTVNIETSNGRFLSTCAEHNSGKTTIAGLVGAYWASFVESPNEVISVANDLEQAQGRIYAAMMPSIKKMGWYVPEKAPIMENKATGSKIRAIGTNYAGEAGGNYGLTLWSELWAMTSEARKRLWEEMTPVPTRRYSIRWVETYAGFLGESDLLWNLYCQAFKEGDEGAPLGQKIPGLEDLPCQYIPGSRLLVYWNHEPRMPWQTQEYYEQQRADLRPNAFLRLHRNMWVTSEEIFIEPKMWDVLEDCEPLIDDKKYKKPIVLGVDASVSNDSTALVAASWDRGKKAPEIVAAWVWKPQFDPNNKDKKIIDLNETLKVKIKEVCETHDVLAVYYDMYQLSAVMTELQKEFDKLGTKKMFVNFPQSSGRIASDQYFYQVITTKVLKHIKHSALREHVLNAVAEETERGYRLAKSKTSNKIDLAVAASMACYGASQRNKPPRKFVKI